MTKEGQIEEMGDIVNYKMRSNQWYGFSEHDLYKFIRSRDFKFLAKAIYNAGYRKADEVRKETAREIHLLMLEEMAKGVPVDEATVRYLAKHLYGVEVKE